MTTLESIAKSSRQVIHSLPLVVMLAYPQATYSQAFSSISEPQQTTEQNKEEEKKKEEERKKEEKRARELVEGERQFEYYKKKGRKFPGKNEFPENQAKQIEDNSKSLFRRVVFVDAFLGYDDDYYKFVPGFGIRPAFEMGKANFWFLRDRYFYFGSGVGVGSAPTVKKTNRNGRAEYYVGREARPMLNVASTLELGRKYGYMWHLTGMALLKPGKDAQWNPAISISVLK